MTEYPQFRELKQRTRFTFVRHGESEANRKQIIQGHTDSPLSESGRGHALAAGRWLADQEVEIIFSSPLGRSHETAAIIATEIGVAAPTVLDELIEIDTGIYSGEIIREHAKRDPDLFRQFLIHSWEVVDGAEKRADIMRRAIVAWARLISAANHGKKHIVCVSHGGMLQWLIKATFATPEHCWMPLFEMANCGVSTFVAESTSLEHDGKLPPGTGYYGIWKQINHVPYEREGEP